MTALRIVLGLVAWIVAAVPVAVVIGIAIRRADRQETPTEPDELCALVQPESWSQAATDAEFTAMIPGLVTADVFVLDAQLNRRAQGWTA